MALNSIFLSRPFAHRGLHGKEITENSRAAFQAAMCKGFGIELDVQGLADSSPVVFHDDFLERLTNAQGQVSHLKVKNLEKIYLSNGESIPTLEEILNLVNGKVPILLEVKDQDGMLGKNIGQLVQKTANLINAYRGPLAAMSFNPFVVKALENLSPKIPRGLVTDDFFSKEWGFLGLEQKESLNKMLFSKTSQLDFISHNVTKIRSPQINLARKEHLPILCWTVRSSIQEREARKIFDNITFENYFPNLG